MYFKSKTISLLILGVASFTNSRTLFAFIDDPEGPNLLIVIVMAGILFGASLLVYVYPNNQEGTGLMRLVIGVVIQILLVAGALFLIGLGY